MLQDIEGLNPLYLLGSLAADSEPTCECYTCQTTGGSQSYFLNVGLTPDFDSSLCTKVDPSVCAKTTENFTDGNLLIVGLVILSIFIGYKYSSK